MGVADFLCTLLEPLVIYGLFIFIMKFVFLENGIPGRRGWIYRLVICILVLIVAFLDQENAIYQTFIFTGTAFDMMVGHQGKIFSRILSGVLVVPILGLMTGFTSLPVTIGQLVTKDTTGNNYLTLIIFSTLILLVIIAFLWKPQVVKNIIKNAESRTLKVWERLLLCFVGIVQLMDVEDIFKETIEEVELYNAVLLIKSMTGCLMTILVVILVLVGNRQNYYYNKVSSMQYNIILTMAEIVENRDKSTGGHIKRTAAYVKIIANQLKKNPKYKKILTDAYVADICVAAPLHDIGKIHVSDLILNKNGRLEDEEFAIMKTHAAVGRDLLIQAKSHLGEFSYLNVAVDMAGAHHEWWDGSAKGYPDHLQGEEIPLSARIMAVADVFDALASKRCYKPAMPTEKVYAIIREEKGTHFDPDVVEAFFAASQEIEAALNVFNDELAAAEAAE